VEILDSVRAITNIKKKAFVPKIFGTMAFSKTFPRTEVHFLSYLNASFLLQSC
jgi:hypothetical protein